MSAPGLPLADLSVRHAAAELATALPEAAFAGTPLSASETRDRAYILLLSHQATQREADRLRTALADLCGMAEDAPCLRRALAADLAPQEALLHLVAREEVPEGALIEEDGA